MTTRLDGKVALVTGAGAGIGEATARRFAQEGAMVIATDLREEAVQRVAAAISAAGGRAEALAQDVTDEALWAILVEDIVARHGGLHVLVNNAGIALPGSVEDATLSDWRTTQAINGESVFFGTRAAIGAMKENGGSIINISSIEGIVGEANVAAYNYSKGGVRIFTKSAALHCAKEGYPIRVNSVHPGFILTAMVEEGIASMPQAVQDEMQDRLRREIPMGGAMGEPLDIANGCLFLASDESKYMTGSELVIDGGYTCH
ncbi:glucose 1-dehydrogenase [Seongchinamella sediminis]|uniref:Glucose 1-dehydrogenase n=1 Tax=Seongchinamella sediminis TaxID=2283635 RepID=A0A3L7DVA1_9GAMM|nr:glucose 1-dehydrogenase [Seongchinamella sediminis]RLQ21046.1 glucose 1-dehydrogenase [Seongchinamella sediminis]